ncbi:MAG: cyanoglobin [Myxococcus sp.]|nr:cyanoglobin [Myxococcus sp.]
MTTLRIEGDGSYRPTEADPPYARLGGVDAVKALVEAFYDAMEAHEPELTALHRCEAPGKVSRASRDHFASFLVYWLGGPQAYLETRGHPRLRMRHGKTPVTVEMRDAWLRAMKRALDEKNVTGGVRAYLDERFADVANFLRNVEE